MSATTTIPVIVTPEAAAFVREKGWEQELERMLDHTLQTVPDLLRVRVVKETDYTCGGVYINIEANRAPVADPVADRTNVEWLQWRTETFPLEVSWHFALTSYYEDHDNHGR